MCFRPPSTSKAPCTPSSPTQAADQRCRVEFAFGQRAQGVADFQRGVAHHEPQVELLVAAAEDDGPVTGLQGDDLAVEDHPLPVDDVREFAEFYPAAAGAARRVSSEPTPLMPLQY